MFLDNQGYSYQFKNNKFYGLPFEVNEMISQEGVKDFICHQSLLRLDQGIIRLMRFMILRFNRKLILSPTGSGKSLMIYSVVRFHVGLRRKVLLVVPTTSLVEQMFKDFESYGWDATIIVTGFIREEKEPM